MIVVLIFSFIAIGIHSDSGVLTPLWMLLSFLSTGVLAFAIFFLIVFGFIVALVGGQSLLITMSSLTVFIVSILYFLVCALILFSLLWRGWIYFRLPPAERTREKLSASGPQTFESARLKAYHDLVRRLLCGLKLKAADVPPDFVWPRKRSLKQIEEPISKPLEIPEDATLKERLQMSLKNWAASLCVKPPAEINFHAQFETRRDFFYGERILFALGLSFVLFVVASSVAVMASQSVCDIFSFLSAQLVAFVNTSVERINVIYSKIVTVLGAVATAVTTAQRASSPTTLSAALQFLSDPSALSCFSVSDFLSGAISSNV